MQGEIIDGTAPWPAVAAQLEAAVQAISARPAARPTGAKAHTVELWVCVTGAGELDLISKLIAHARRLAEQDQQIDLAVGTFFISKTGETAALTLSARVVDQLIGMLQMRVIDGWLRSHPQDVEREAAVEPDEWLNRYLDPQQIEITCRLLIESERLGGLSRASHFVTTVCQRLEHERLADFIAGQRLRLDDLDLSVAGYFAETGQVYCSQLAALTQLEADIERVEQQITRLTRALAGGRRIAEELDELHMLLTGLRLKLAAQLDEESGEPMRERAGLDLILDLLFKPIPRELRQASQALGGLAQQLGHIGADFEATFATWASDRLAPIRAWLT